MEIQQKITPWEVIANSEIDYTALIDEFGCQPIDNTLLQKFEYVTGKQAHIWLKRGIFFSHRDFNSLLNDYESDKKFYMYTGRGPSSESLHLGHMVPFMFTQYLQECFDVPLVIQMSDDEKFYFKDLDIEEVHKLGMENAKDIIACGYDPSKTFIFSNMDYIGNMYRTIMKLDKLTKGKLINQVYGLTLDHNIGQLSWASKQIAPAFSESFPHLFGKDKIRCLIPCAIDQDPYFRMARDFAHKYNYPKPSLLHSKFLVSLSGINAKMSSTHVNYNILMSDTPQQIKDKITKHAFSGAAKTLKEHRENGVNLNVDVAYQYLRYFEPDDQILDKVTNDYGSGKMSTKDVKDLCILRVTEFVLHHQTQRQHITDDTLKKYFSY